MEPLNLIVKALAAGAANNMQPNIMGLENTAIIDQYHDIKELLARKYAKVDADLLDIGPASVERQQLLLTQLQAAGAADDEELFYQAEILLAAIQEQDPEALWAAMPIDHDEPAREEIEAAVDSAIDASLEEE